MQEIKIILPEGVTKENLFDIVCQATDYQELVEELVDVEFSTEEELKNAGNTIDKTTIQRYSNANDELYKITAKQINIVQNPISKKEYAFHDLGKQLIKYLDNYRKIIIKKEFKEHEKALQDELDSRIDSLPPIQGRIE